ncbi:threonine ammonia-lyase [Hoeflea poritis]|uniref:Pyridoxal-phosphate dependent enzyme n=1 Tax=Hoeflea poritis TaxID=2993659 RepID=A0ABT4VHU0_9HYPH|nr:pyridoxal-phosphate dependent enzyme [Hoeflea poritis]MDA4844240.1 pyridoxal-phosphate dependent enzyme [Hoeflea poritis]
MQDDIPNQEDIRNAAKAIEGEIIRTPMLPLRQDAFADLFGDARSVSMKLELFQHAGSFKARGNLLGIGALSAQERAAGVIAASGGNHALAVSWAAAKQHVRATLVMPKATDRLRVDGCRKTGAEVILVDDIAAAFEEMNRLSVAEGMTVMHPFEGIHMTLGAATLGAEIIEDLPGLDCMIVAVGGGGLIGGVAAAIRQNKPDCEVIGVEPFGADSLSQSFERGEPVRIGKVDTIADSLGSPAALPFSYAVARNFVSRIVRIEDGAMLDAMALMRDGLKLVAEPACAAALAAATGPLRRQLAGKNVCVLACGSNIGAARYNALLDGR